MKNTIFLLALTVATLMGKAQTLQQVTDNGATTSNTMSINTGHEGLKLLGNSYLSFRDAGGLSRVGYMQHDGSNLIISSDVGNVGFSNHVGIGTSVIDNAQGWNKVLQLNGPSHAKLLVTESSGVKVGIYSHTGYNGKIGTESNHNLTFTAGYWNDVMTLTTAGNVGIGTLLPGEKLSVNGNIRAREIKVENGNWPDYVFTRDYQLPTLQETEKHIKDKGHLPGIPSAAEVKANGVDLGGMNAKLLQKIEELTLHAIEQNKKIKNLEDIIVRNNLK